MSGNLDKSAVATDWKRYVFTAIPKKGDAKECLNCSEYNWAHFTCKQGYAPNPSREASAVHNRELPDVQAGFRKGKGTRDPIANIPWIIEKAREFQKNIYFCFIRM